MEGEKNVCWLGEVVRQPMTGQVTMTGDGSVTYTPAPGFARHDSFAVTLRDQQGVVSAPGEITICRYWHRKTVFMARSGSRIAR